MPLPPIAAFLVPLLGAAQAADVPDAEPAGPAWRGQRQCSTAWTDPADEARGLTLSTESDSTNLKLWFSDHPRAGDPPPATSGETLELAPRKAIMTVSGLGAGPVEVNSLPTGDNMVLHDVTLGHVEKLDALPDRFTVTLAIGDAPPMTMEVREFSAARVYLKSCLARGE